MQLMCVCVNLPTSLAAVLGQSINVLVCLCWGHSSLTDLHLKCSFVLHQGSNLQYITPANDHKPSMHTRQRRNCTLTLCM